MKQGRGFKFIVSTGAGVVLLAVAGVIWMRGTNPVRASGVAPAAAPVGDDPTRDAPEVPQYPVLINVPPGPPVVEVDDVDQFGRPVSIACSTCHSIRDPNPSNRTPADLDEFHQDMVFSHGDLSCFACHNSTNYDALRLADQTSITYPEVMTLCSQCHGTQARDYAHGAHGGMSGYWDLTRGPRTRNNCVDCHDPHAPAFPTMIPTFKPRDRFLDPAQPPREGRHD